MRLPVGASLWARVPPPAPVPIMMTSKWFVCGHLELLSGSGLLFCSLVRATVTVSRFTDYPRRGLAGDILRAKRRRAEVDAKAGAPDADRLVFVQVGIRGHVVVLVAFVAFERTEVDKACLRDGGIVVGHLGGDQVDMHVGPIGSFEVGETEYPLAVRELMNCRRAFSLVC